MKEKMKERRQENRRSRENEEIKMEKHERKDFFDKNLENNPNPPDELAQHVSTKIPFGPILPNFFVRKIRILLCF